jgi:uncharacterized protein (TIGR00296 family)
MASAGDVMYTLEEGRLAVELARKVVEAWVQGRKELKLPKDLPASFGNNAGIFVTINSYPGKELRGCIGYPEPIMPLIEALVDGAKSASTRDPRFPPVTPKELDSIIIEVSLLTPPELIKVKDPKDYLNLVKIGRDGLIVQSGFSRGLLLPQVPVEWEWDVHTFLDHTCMKAGLDADTWMEKGTKLFSFTAEIFDETKPKGEIVARPLSEKGTTKEGPRLPANRK